jgi:sulfite exporter TauE/SafE
VLISFYVLIEQAIRFLPALILGLGVALSLRPGHALAEVSDQLFSLQRKGLLASAWAGLVAGGLHTLTGPDHLAALAPLCIGRSRIQSAAVGALWGCGHDAGQIIFGLIFLVLKDKLHIELIRTWASRVVGLVLITIGAIGIYESQEPLPMLAEEGGRLDGGGEPVVRIKNDSKNATTFATGVVYGLQPDALLVILPALALPSRATGAAFLVMFLLGTILAMGSYTLFISSCSHALQKRLPGITKNLSLGSSIIAIGLGIALVVSELMGFSIF